MPKKLKVAQVEAQSGPGLLDRYDISGPLNAKLYALQKRSNEISRITYITNTRTGEITSAIVEYYHRSQKKKNNSDQKK